MYLPYVDRSALGHTARGLQLVDRARFGPALVSRVVAPPHNTIRGSSFVDPAAALMVGVVLEGSLRIDIDGRTLSAEAGEIAIFELVDMDRFAITEDFKAVTMRLSSGVIAASPDDVRLVERAPVDARSGVGSVLRATMAQVYRSRLHLTPELRDRLGHTLVSLTQVVVDERIRALAPTGDLSSRVVGAALQFIESNLWDAALTPSSIASAQHVSVRALHQAFENESFTVSRTIALKRLEGARGDLERSPGASGSISAVARRWGFTSASHFSRAFREAFGSSPTEWQRTHHAGADLSPVNPPSSALAREHTRFEDRDTRASA